MQECEVWAKGPVFGHICNRLYMWKPSGHIRQNSQYSGGEKKASDYCRISALNTRSLTQIHTHTVHKPWWCQQLSGIKVLPLGMTAALISGRPSVSHVSSNWWKFSIQAQAVSRSFVSSDRQKDRQATSPTTFKQHTFIKIHHRGITSEKRLEAKCANLTAPNCSSFAIVMMCSGFFYASCLE